MPVEMNWKAMLFVVVSLIGGILLIIRLTQGKVLIPYTKAWWEEWRKR